MNRRTNPNVDPRIHATPCAIALGAFKPHHLKHVSDALRAARAVIARHDVGANGPGDRILTGKLVSNPEPGLHIIPGPDSTMLDIRLPDIREVRIEIAPLSAGATSLIESPPRSPVDPVDAVRRIIDAAETHYQGMDLRRIPPEERETRIALLEAIETHVRTTRGDPRLMVDGKGRHAHAAVAAATPWSRLTARTMNGYGEPGRDRLTDAERRRWTRSPVLEISTRLQHRLVHPEEPNVACTVLSIAPLRAEPLANPSMVEDMRRLLALDPPPPTPRRTGP